MARPAGLISELAQLNRNQGWMVRINRILILLCLLSAAAAGLELGPWLAQQFRQSVKEVLPPLEELNKPLEPIQKLEWTSKLFPMQVSRSQATPVKQQIAGVASPENPWRLKGIQVGASRRAYLQQGEAGSSGVWVKEGERVGPWTVKEIQERSVLVEEEGGKVYELRM